jgi:hypothetical protein
MARYDRPTMIQTRRKRKIETNNSEKEIDTIHVDNAISNTSILDLSR